MKTFFLFILLTPLISFSQKTIHVYVSLCDNQYQGIVPVPEKIGNGKDAFNNLYWGALYGIKTHFKNSNEWTLLKSFKNPETNIIERCLFKHSSKNVYLLAEAYDGEQIETCTSNFLKSAFSMNSLEVEFEDEKLSFAKDADLVAYIGHNGLMDFNLNLDNYEPENGKEKDVIILACISQYYFTPFLKKSCANPLLLTAHLMAPEAYSLKAAIESWLNDNSDEKVRTAAAQSYAKYQKCSLNAAKNILVTGFDSEYK